MIKAFVLTMVLSTSNGGAAIATHEYPNEIDCLTAATEYLKSTKHLAPITYSRAWCSVTHKD